VSTAADDGTVFDIAERADRVMLNAENDGERYAIIPGEPRPSRHPLLEAAIDEVGVPDDIARLVDW
jgi:D-glycero-alpha-D-manno-heptose-7-phosphate kinase